MMQEVEADSEEEAIEKFYDDYNPQGYVIEDQVSRVGEGPVNVYSAEDRWSDQFPIEDWKYEVENGDTKLGYGEWLAAKSEIAED
jgi:hypothetical protein